MHKNTSFSILLIRLFFLLLPPFFPVIFLYVL